MHFKCKRIILAVLLVSASLIAHAQRDGGYRAYEDNDIIIATLMGGLPSGHSILICFLIGVPLIIVGKRIITLTSKTNDQVLLQPLDGSNKVNAGLGLFYFGLILFYIGIAIIGIPVLAWVEMIFQGYVLPFISVVAAIFFVCAILYIAFKSVTRS